MSEFDPVRGVAALLESAREALARLPRVQRRANALSASRALIATAQIFSLLLERSLIFSLGTPLRDMTDQAVLETFAALNEHRTNTARRLGISRRALYDRLRAKGRKDKPT